MRIPRKITQQPMIRVIFIAFFNLNFEIIFSVGNGSKTIIKPSIKQLKDAMIAPKRFAKGNKNIPTGIPNTHITFTIPKIFSNFSLIS